jgi:hypothetical protein
MQEFHLGSAIGSDRFNQSLENPLLNVNCFAAPATFTPGSAGRIQQSQHAGGFYESAVVW